MTGVTQHTEHDTRPIRVIEDNENTLDVLEQFDTKTDTELGIVQYDQLISGDVRWFAYNDNGVWNEYFESIDRTDSYESDVLPSLLHLLGGEKAIVPVAAMPYFGNGDLSAETVFE